MDNITFLCFSSKLSGQVGGGDCLDVDCLVGCGEYLEVGGETLPGTSSNAGFCIK